MQKLVPGQENQNEELNITKKKARQMGKIEQKKLRWEPAVGEESAKYKLDAFVKSPISMSFRAKREILWEQAIEKIGFLPTVEMTNTSFPTFYELVKLYWS